MEYSTTPREEKKKNPGRKQAIVQIDDLLVQKLITPITLGEYFPLGFFDKNVTISTHMVSCNETSKEDELSEMRKAFLVLNQEKLRKKKG